MAIAFSFITFIIISTIILSIIAALGFVALITVIILNRKDLFTPNKQTN